MASETNHIALANRNHATLLHLMREPDQHPEWIATVAFYKAVHVAEAAFATNGSIHSTSHHQRLLTLKMSRFSPMFRDYRVLLSASRIARYLEDGGDTGVDGRSFINPPLGRFTTFTDWMPADDVVPHLVYGRLFRLEQAAIPLFSPEGRSALEKITPPPAGDP